MEEGLAASYAKSLQPKPRPRNRTGRFHCPEIHFDRSATEWLESSLNRKKNQLKNILRAGVGSNISPRFSLLSEGNRYTRNSHRRETRQTKFGAIKELEIGLCERALGIGNSALEGEVPFSAPKQQPRAVPSRNVVIFQFEKSTAL